MRATDQGAAKPEKLGDIRRGYADRVQHTALLIKNTSINVWRKLFQDRGIKRETIQSGNKTGQRSVRRTRSPLGWRWKWQSVLK